MNKNNKTKINADTDTAAALFASNEVKTNRIAAVSLLSIIAVIAAFGILIVAGVIRTQFVWAGWVINACCLFDLLLLALLRAVGFDDRRAKYFVLFGIIFISGLASFLYPTAAVFIFGGPILLSVKYYNPKLSAAVSVAAWLMFMLCTAANVALDTVSAEVHSLHMEQQIYTWGSVSDNLLYYVLPVSSVYLIEGALAYHIARACGTMVVDQGKISARAALLSAEMSTAAQIQFSSLAPSDFTTPDGKMSLCASVSPAGNVGGDFYDYFMLGDRLLVVAVADVSDKGLPAAMYAVKAQSCLRFAFFETFRNAATGETETIDLERAVNAVNRQLSLHNTDGTFVTMWVGCFDTKTGMGKYVNAGHLPPYVIHRDGTATRITNEPQLFMGAFEDAALTSGVLRLRHGDTLVLFTDGATDARNTADETFGEERLCAALCEAVKDRDDGQYLPRRVTAAVSDALEAFSGGANRYDDVTVLSLLYSGEASTQKFTIHLTADGECAARVIDFVQEKLQDGDCPDVVRQNLGVMIDEVCSNVADYAYGDKPGTLCVKIHLGGNFISLRFLDSGIAFNPLCAAVPDTDNEPQIGGLGIHLIKNLADDIRYRREDGKNVLTIYKVWNT